MIKDMNDVELEKNEVALFENQFIEAFKQMAAISKQKKDLDAKEKKFKEQLEKAKEALPLLIGSQLERSQLLKSLASNPDVRRLAEAIAKRKSNVVVDGLKGSSAALYFAALLNRVLVRDAGFAPRYIG